MDRSMQCSGSAWHRVHTCGEYTRPRRRAVTPESYLRLVTAEKASARCSCAALFTRVGDGAVTGSGSHGWAAAKPRRPGPEHHGSAREQTSGRDTAGIYGGTFSHGASAAKAQTAPLPPLSPPPWPLELACLTQFQCPTAGRGGAGATVAG